VDWEDGARNKGVRRRIRIFSAQVRLVRVQGGEHYLDGLLGQCELLSPLLRENKAQRFVKLSHLEQSKAEMYCLECVRGDSSCTVVGASHGHPFLTKLFASFAWSTVCYREEDYLTTRRQLS
jgi:hypothetical protein